MKQIFIGIIRFYQNAFPSNTAELQVLPHLLKLRARGDQNAWRFKRRLAHD